MSDRLTVELETRPCRCDITKLYIRELTTGRLLVACMQCRSEHTIGFPKYVTDLVAPSPFPEPQREQPEQTLEVRFREQERPESDDRDSHVVSHARSFTPYDVRILRWAKIVIDDAMLEEMRIAAGSAAWKPEVPDD